ncbi:hypothetical protein OHS18_38030 [Amycolatopsis sp. NBC_00355]|uniref:hypothetical protein n=1 Tax=Amycolatopsis sp. NBC_00355 TaxID=2975957 RepID=UPI002E276302
MAAQRPLAEVARVSAARSEPGCHGSTYSPIRCSAAMVQPDAVALPHPVERLLGRRVREDAADEREIRIPAQLGREVRADGGWSAAARREWLGRF